MSDNQMLDENQIRARGIIKNIPRTLDDGDCHVEAAHWFNTSGTRMYSLERVKAAEQLIESSSRGEYFHQSADYINSQPLPYTPAIFVFDYRIILKAIDPNLSYLIWRARLCHPVAGRMPGSSMREYELVQEALAKIVQYADPSADVGSEKELLGYFESISDQASKNLKAPWPNVVLRKPKLRSSISRGKGAPSAKKIINILSLIHSGIVSYELISPDELDIFELLVASPMIRVDHRISNDCE